MILYNIICFFKDPPSTGGGSYDETLEKGMIMSDGKYS